MGYLVLVIAILTLLDVGDCVTPCSNKAQLLYITTRKCAGYAKNDHSKSNLITATAANTPQEWIKAFQENIWHLSADPNCHKGCGTPGRPGLEKTSHPCHKLKVDWVETDHYKKRGVPFDMDQCLKGCCIGDNIFYRGQGLPNENDIDMGNNKYYREANGAQNIQQARLWPRPPSKKKRKNNNNKIDKIIMDNNKKNREGAVDRNRFVIWYNNGWSKYYLTFDHYETFYELKGDCLDILKGTEELGAFNLGNEQANTVYPAAAHLGYDGMIYIYIYISLRYIYEC